MHPRQSTLTLTKDQSEGSLSLPGPWKVMSDTNPPTPELPRTLSSTLGDKFFSHQAVGHHPPEEKIRRFPYPTTVISPTPYYVSLPITDTPVTQTIPGRREGTVRKPSIRANIKTHPLLPTLPQPTRAGKRGTVAIKEFFFELQAFKNAIVQIS